MNVKQKLRTAAELGIGLVAVTTLVLAGCGGGGSSAPPVIPATPTTAVNITPFKGAFAQGATVTLKDANGNPVTPVTGGTIGADGVANLTIATTVSYPLLVEVSGTYFNELTGQPETSTVPLRSLITDVAATSNVPVTIVTETAVADLQNSIGGGNFSSANPIRAASAVAALDLAGVNLGIPATAIPVFNHATNQTSDDNTFRLAALAVVANSQGTGTLANKVKTLAHSMATLNAASSPADVVSQAAFDAAISNMTSGASSVAAAGVTPPAAPVLKSMTLADLAGTWSRHRIQAGRTTIDLATSAPASVSSNWNFGTETYDGAGTGSCGPEWKNAGSGVVSTPACTPPFTVSISPTGVISEHAVPSDHAIMSASKALIVATRTAGNGFDPRLVILQKQVLGVTFAQTDLAGTWDLHGIQVGRTWSNPLTGGPAFIAGKPHTSNSWAHRVDTWDLAGVNDTPSNYFDSTGNTVPGAALTLSVAIDGTITHTTDPSLHGTMSASKDLMVMTRVGENSPDPQMLILQKRNPSVTYTQSDLAGTWDFHRLQAGSTTVDPATGLPVSSSNNWAHAVERWDTNGGLSNATSVVTFIDSNGSTTAGGRFYFVVAADGTITDNFYTTARVHGTMSINKDLIVLTRDGGTDSRIIILQKRK